LAGVRAGQREEGNSCDELRRCSAFHYMNKRLFFARME
jgi:hypothetical protein